MIGKSKIYAVVLIILLVYAANWALDEYYPAVEMDPLPEFSYLCDDDDLLRYSSQENTAYLKVGGVWERHIVAVSENDDKERGEQFRFDYEQFKPEIQWTSPGGISSRYLGFYDSDGLVKFRSRMNEAGLWSYEIMLNGQQTEAGTVQVGETSADDSALPQLRIDPANPSAFLAGEKPFYWFGGKWFAAQNLAPCSIWQFRNLRNSQQRTSDEEYLNYLDYLVETQHNSLLLKVAQFPLMNDGVSWDVLWLQRIEWGVREALARGLYVQLNLFDTWSRDRRFKVINDTAGESHPFNVWQPEQEDYRKIQNYLKTIVARFSAYPNIVWEIGNEMEHKPNCGECFVEQANTHYLPWLRAYDPYDHLIGLSEGIWLDTDVDIGFLHQTRAKDFHDLPQDSRPMVLNELVFSDATDALWKDSTARDKTARLAFRRSYWRGFMYNIAGSFEATWLSVQEPLNTPATLMMEDHARLASFMADQNINPNLRQTLGRLASVSIQYETYGMKTSDGRYFFYLLSDSIEQAVTYWGLEFRPEESEPKAYEVEWYDPSNGEYFGRETALVEDRIAGDKIRLKVKRKSFDAVIVLKPVGN